MFYVEMYPRLASIIWVAIHPLISFYLIFFHLCFTWRCIHGLDFWVAIHPLISFYLIFFHLCFTWRCIHGWCLDFEWAFQVGERKSWRMQQKNTCVGLEPSGWPWVHHVEEKGCLWSKGWAWGWVTCTRAKKPWHAVGDGFELWRSWSLREGTSNFKSWRAVHISWHTTWHLSVISYDLSWKRLWVGDGFELWGRDSCRIKA